MREALDSILAQTYQNVEIIIVTDEPTEEVCYLLEEYWQMHPRIIVNHHRQRRGLIASLNEGFALACGKYIARMDADDISLPQRFEKQVYYMENHPDCGVCGSAVIREGYGAPHKVVYPVNNMSIIAMMMMAGCAIVHPAAMIRRDFIRTIEGPYLPGFTVAEDYYLWIRCIGKTELHNLEDALLRYRADGTNICAANAKAQAAQLDQLRALACQKMGFIPQNNTPMREWLHELYLINNSGARIPIRSFNRILGETWYNECLCNAHRGIIAWIEFWGSPLSQFMPLTKWRKVKFLAVCLLRKDLRGLN